MREVAPSEKLALILSRVLSEAVSIREKTGRKVSRALVSRIDAQGTELMMGSVTLGDGPIVVDASYLVEPGYLMLDVAGPWPAG